MNWVPQIHSGVGQYRSCRTCHNDSAHFSKYSIEHSWNCTQKFERDGESDR